MTQEVPSPQFSFLERVIITGDEGRYRDCRDERGTVICLESSAVRRKPTQPDQWLYVVHLPTRAACGSFFQSDLRSMGCFDLEVTHLGVRAEISFDLVFEENNQFMEGSYRLPGEFWKVVIFRQDDVPELKFEPGSWKKSTQWERDMTGTIFRFPQSAKMEREDLLRAMSQAFGYNEWVEVQGPDSMMLR